MGASTGIGYGLALGVSFKEISNGLWGYNSVLSSMAIAGIFYKLNLASVFLSIMCSLLSCVIFGAMKVCMR